MHKTVLIVENRSAYRNRLEKTLRLNSCTVYNCIAVSGISELAALNEEILSTISLVLSSEVFIQYLEEFLPGVKVIELSDNTAPENEDNSNKISRLAPASSISELIEKTIAIPADNTHEATNRDTDKVERKLGTILAFSRSQRINSCRLIIESAKRAGQEIIYLPLMPLYEIPFSFRTGSRNSLSDLLLEIKNGIIPDYEDMGDYLYLHDDGYYTFSCPLRADDLLSADNRSWREFLLILKEYLATRSAPIHAFIEISGLSLERHAMIAALCDYLIIDTPHDLSDAAVIAQQELAIFLSKLPSSCEIYESGHISKLAGEAPWLY